MFLVKQYLYIFLNIYIYQKVPTLHFNVLFAENPTFFVGGPVWALAWLPIPSTLSFSENVSQFIAISTHSTMDAQFSAGSVYSGKNIIQIWNLGDLNHK